MKLEKLHFLFKSGLNSTFKIHVKILVRLNFFRFDPVYLDNAIGSWFTMACICFNKSKIGLDVLLMFRRLKSVLLRSLTRKVSTLMEISSWRALEWKLHISGWTKRLILCCLGLKGLNILKCTKMNSYALLFILTLETAVNPFTWWRFFV